MKEYIGFVGGMCGNELFVNTVGDEPVKLTIKDKELRWKMYSEHVRIRVEEITEKEALDYQNNCRGTGGTPK
jgi:hypothetical protein